MATGSVRRLGRAGCLLVAGAAMACDETGSNEPIGSTPQALAMSSGGTFDGGKLPDSGKPVDDPTTTTTVTVGSGYGGYGGSIGFGGYGGGYGGGHGAGGLEVLTSTGAGDSAASSSSTGGGDPPPPPTSCPKRPAGEPTFA